MNTDTPAKQVWYAGDPEPLDVPELVDREGDTWICLEPNSWYEQQTGPDFACSWSSALEYAPLRRPESPTAASLLADDESADPAAVDRRLDHLAGHALTGTHLAQDGGAA